MRALASGHIPELILCDEASLPSLTAHADRLSDTTIVVADEATRRSATGLAVALSVVGLFPKPANVELDDLLANNDRVVALAQVDNPTNVGAIVRSAAAFGFTGLILDAESSDPYARRALRTAMGTTFDLDIARVTSSATMFAALRERDFETYAMTPSPDAVALDDARPGPRIVLMLGAERSGLADEWMQAAALRVRIPMATGVDSLNVAAAAAVACYGLTRRNG